MKLSIIKDLVAVCRFDAQAPIPEWSLGDGFWSVTRSAGELSVICAEERVPGDVRCERGWRVLELQGPFGFDEVGVLLPIAESLAAAGVSILPLATFDTDYLLIKQQQLPVARACLVQAGHEVLDRP